MTFFSLQGFGSYTPEHRVSNKDIEALVDTTDEWIVSRSGIKARHQLAEGEHGSDAGTVAARGALQSAGLASEEITHLITATCTPDYLCPSTACIISGNLGLTNAMAFDLNAACSGFVYGLEVARGLLALHTDAKILLVSTEALTRRLNWKDRGTSVLFGDGAGAVILSSEKPQPMGAQLVDVLCHADGSQYSLLTVGGGCRLRYNPGDPVQDSFYIQMQGREVFRYAVRSLTQVCKDLLDRQHLCAEDIDLFIPHQANLRIIEAVGSRLEVQTEKVYVNVDEHGNTSAASIPIALHEALSEGRIQPGMRVLLGTFGGGFTWGAALLQF